MLAPGTGSDYVQFIDARDLGKWIVRCLEANVMQLSAARAERNGLSLRPLSETIRDTHTWFTSLPVPRQRSLRSGISAERKAQVLAAWHRETRALAPGASEQRFA